MCNKIGHSNKVNYKVYTTLQHETFRSVSLAKLQQFQYTCSRQHIDNVQSL